VVGPARQESAIDGRALRDRLRVETQRDLGTRFQQPKPSPSKTREEASRLEDELTMLQAERQATTTETSGERTSAQLNRSRSRQADPVDDFDAATNPLHEKTAIYKPPEHPTSKVAKFFKYIHGSSFLVRYFTYIVPVVLILLIPVLIGGISTPGQNANVGGVELLWFGVWLEIVWLSLWAGRVLARCLPYPMGLVSSLFTNDSKKWRDMGKQLEIPATVFFWWVGIEVSFLPTMTNHHVGGNRATKQWETTLNKIIIAVFVGAVLNFIEKIIIQLIAISFHLRTYADRIELNKFQIGSLTKLYIYSRSKIAMEDAEFEEKPSGPVSGARTPAMYADKATKALNDTFAKVGDIAGTVAGDFTGKEVAKSGHPAQVILTLLNSTPGSQVLARRLYRTFVRDGFDTVSSEDLKHAFENQDEAQAAFSMFDKDMNGDISMEELESVCVEIGRERKSITASLKDLDSVVSKLDDVLFFIVVVVAILVLVSLISTSAAGVLTSAGSAVLALSWLFSATAQEFLQSVIFVFVKHPFDVGDRVSIYGNTGSSLKGDDYFVKEIALLYTEFKKMEGHVVQAPNSYLNTLFILNMRRSGGLAEAVPIVIRFGTTLDQIDSLRSDLLDFVKSEKREYQGNILTELREVTEAYSLTLNVVFFYKTNWQNELVRLTRRNKFICALMTAMQQNGIEGPRRNQAGWRQEAPMYMTYPPGMPPPLYSANFAGNNDNGPTTDNGTEISGPSEQIPINHPSILRHRSEETGGGRRGRAESLSQIAKRVDFSLGMKDIQSGDTMSDVYEDRERPKYTDIIRESNRLDEERRLSEIDEEGVAHTTGRSSSRGHSAEGDPTMAHGILRRSTTQSLGGHHHRGSVGSGETHRNRFMPSFRRSGRSVEVPRDSLAEEGRNGPIDPRSGRISSQAVRMDSASTQQPGSIRNISSIQAEPPQLAPVTSETRDFEMRSLNRQP